LLLCERLSPQQKLSLIHQSLHCSKGPSGPQALFRESRHLSLRDPLESPLGGREEVSRIGKSSELVSHLSSPWPSGEGYIIDVLIMLHERYQLTIYNNSKTDRVFLSSNNNVASSLRIQFHWLSLRDSRTLVTPFIPAYN